MQTITVGTIAFWLGSGFVSLLILIAFFTIKDMYRRLRKVEDSREDNDKKIIAIELTLSSNSKTLESMALSLQRLTISQCPLIDKKDSSHPQKL